MCVVHPTFGMQPVVEVTSSTGILAITSLQVEMTSAHRLFWPKICEIAERRAVAGVGTSAIFRFWFGGFFQNSFRVESWNFGYQ